MIPTRRFKRGKRQPRGQGLVEFLLAVPVVLFLLFGVFEFGRFYFARMTLQHAVSEAARFAITGAVTADSLGNPMSRAESIVGAIQTHAVNLDVDVSDVTITPPDGGGPGDVVSVQARFGFQFLIPGYRVFFPDGVLAFQVSTTMKNEPFFVPTGQGGVP